MYVHVYMYTPPRETELFYTVFFFIQQKESEYNRHI